MGNGGCLEDIDWKDIVGLYFDEARGRIEIPTIIRIATKTSKRLGEKALYIDRLKEYREAKGI